jgi:hypothetical protein
MIASLWTVVVVSGLSQGSCRMRGLGVRSTLEFVVGKTVVSSEHRRYMAGLGLVVTVASVASMILDDWASSPSWLSPLVNFLVIFVAIYSLRYLESAPGGSTRPTLLSVTLTGLLSLAACVLVVVTLEGGIATYLLAGAAILGVWMLSAWWVGQRG